MGFPVGYTELMLPKFLLHVVFFLGYLRRIITWAFDLVGLGDLLLDSSDIPPPSSTAVFSPSSDHFHPNTPKPLFAVLVQEALPVTVYDSSSDDDDPLGTCSCCAVCLHEFTAGDEVRRLSNCRHVFHRCCLDPWVELDQRTCPLCRSPLVPDRIKDEIDRKLRRDGGSVSLQPAFYYDNYGGDFYDESFGFVLPSSQVEPFRWPSEIPTIAD